MRKGDAGNPKARRLGVGAEHLRIVGGSPCPAGAAVEKLQEQVVFDRAVVLPEKLLLLLEQRFHAGIYQLVLVFHRPRPGTPAAQALINAADRRDVGAREEKREQNAGRQLDQQDGRRAEQQLVCRAVVHRGRYRGGICPARAPRDKRRGALAFAVGQGLPAVIRQHRPAAVCDLKRHLPGEKGVLENAQDIFQINPNRNQRPPPRPGAHDGVIQNELVWGGRECLPAGAVVLRRLLRIPSLKADRLSVDEPGVEILGAVIRAVHDDRVAVFKIDVHAGDRLAVAAHLVCRAERLRKPAAGDEVLRGHRLHNVRIHQNIDELRVRFVELRADHLVQLLQHDLVVHRLLLPKVAEISAVVVGAEQNGKEQHRKIRQEDEEKEAVPLCQPPQAF